MRIQRDTASLMGRGWPLRPVYVLVLFLAACSAQGDAASVAERLRASGVSLDAPQELAAGEALFHDNCAGCHGVWAVGTDRGPTFLSKIYAPDHHGDIAFEMAPRNGVRAHHWQFGDMPKIAGIAPDQVKEVVRYIRWIQQQATAAGVYE